MKALFIGGTGTISTEISKLCIQQGWEPQPRQRIFPCTRRRARALRGHSR